MPRGYQQFYSLPSVRGDFERRGSAAPLFDAAALRSMAGLADTDATFDAQLTAIELSVRQQIEAAIGLPASLGTCLDRYSTWLDRFELTARPSEAAASPIAVSYVDTAHSNQKVDSDEHPFEADVTGEGQAVVFLSDTPAFPLSDRFAYPVMVSYSSGPSMYDKDGIIEEAARYMISARFHLGHDSEVNSQLKKEVDRLLYSCRRDRLVKVAQ